MKLSVVSYVQTSCFKLGTVFLLVSAGSYALQTYFPGGILNGIALFFVYIFQLVSEVDREEANDAKQQLDRVSQRVVDDFKQVKELFQYVGTLKDGTVNVQDFKEVLELNYQDCPTYAMQALAQFQRQEQEFMSYQTFLHAANQEYLKTSKSRLQTPLLSKVINT